MTHGNRALLAGALFVTALGGLALDGTPAAAGPGGGRGRVGYERDVAYGRDPYYPARRYRDCDDRIVRVREYIEPAPRYYRVSHPRDCGCSVCRPVVYQYRENRFDRYCDHW